MDVAILYSGGKDSTYAIHHAKEKGWNIKYLVSVKPTRKDCFLFHFATVEHTKEFAKQLGIPHFYVSCSVADPAKEADIVKKVVEINQNKKELKVNSVVLGGTGLQETQLKSIQNALKPLNIDVFAAHAGEEHDLIVQQMLDRGYEIMITQIASDGLKNWLGKKITKDNFTQLKQDSIKYGFHIGFEGGYADTLVTNCPLFENQMVVDEMKLKFEDNYCGHVEISKYRMQENKRLKEEKQIVY